MYTSVSKNKLESAPETIKNKRFLLNTFIYSIFLLPFSINGIGANYLFLSPFLFVVFVHARIRRVAPIFLTIIFIYILIFVLASIYQIDFYPDFLRRLSSFFIFLSLFVYMFVDLSDIQVKAFKLALIVVSVCLSLTSMLTFVVKGGASLGFDAKDVVGTQRTGFIYIIALWIIFYDFKRIPATKVIKGAIAGLCFLGLLLTFSRASIVALFGSFFIYFSIMAFRWFFKPLKHHFFTFLKGIIIIICVFVLLGQVFPLFFDFFGERLFSATVAENISNPDASEGIRIVLIKLMYNFIIHNPLTGTGYLGIWVISQGAAGSAHNQYMDIFLRTGFIGFSCFILLMVFTLRFLYKEHRSLFWGMCGVILYGFFHETFKESHGTFVLSFLFGMMAQKNDLINND